MLSGPDLADLIGYARACGAKVILAGDVGQLQAVQNGGGMSLLAAALGHVRLAEPVWFRNQWERQTSLRLRDGDVTVLAEYDQHGRIIGGPPEQVMDAVAAAYVALSADGTDVLLMAADHALRRELSRRIRDDLIALGIVQDGPTVRISDGVRASPGDLIMCTRNDHTVQAGEPGRALANGGLLRIEAITRCGLVVRRAFGPDPRTGQRRWTDRTFLYQHFSDAELGYAVTDHVAQGRTVHTGLAVDHRNRGPPARLRGPVLRHRHQPRLRVHTFTQARRPGARPAASPGTGPLRPPRRRTRRAARPRRRDRRGAGGAGRGAGPGRPAALGHPDPQPGLADADHLGLLHAIWTAETAQARQRRYQDLLLAALPPGYRAERGHQARWLWRTLRAAELADLDAGQILASAIGERDLGGARDIAAVIDARLRYRFGSLVPLSPGPWSAHVPAIADPERRAYLTEIAALMDARKGRLGEHAADHAPPWAITALGPVPAHPLDRLDWQRRASSIGAWRELSGYDHPTDPIGPEPVAAAPDMRAAWHEAFAALGPADGPDVRGMADGMLWHLRDTYPIETAWAPQYVGDELRQVRAAAWEARLAGLRANVEARTAQQHGNHAEAARQRDLASSYQALHETYLQREEVFAATMADRADWDKATVQQRHLAVAADAELRRRHPASTTRPCGRPNPIPPLTPSVRSSP